MANDWIKCIKGLTDKREVVAMALRLKPTGILSQDCEIVACKWLKVWGWADSETVDGHVQGVTGEFVDAVAGLAGFFAAAEVVGWATPKGSGITFNNWGRHNGATAKARAMEQAKKARQRIASEACPDSVPIASGQSRDNIGTTSGPEKRREEKNVNPKAEEPPLPPTGGGCVDPPGFVQFWEAWPSHFRKSARAKCLTHWRSAGLESLALVIVASVAAWRASEQWTKDTGQFIPAPLPWLRDRRWEAAAPPAKEERNGHSGSTGANRPARSGGGGNQAAREFPQLITLPVKRYGQAVGGPTPGSAGAA